MLTTSNPSGWNSARDSGWDRVKEAVHRDWEQTKQDLHVAGGHELNQGVLDTLGQAANREAIPGNNRPNRPKVIGSWDEAEMPIGFGYDARRQYGAAHPGWNAYIEETLRAEWARRRDASEREWGDVSGWVRYGYEYRPNP
jgi:hypothetical protein